MSATQGVHHGVTKEVQCNCTYTKVAAMTRCFARRRGKIGFIQRSCLRDSQYCHKKNAIKHSPEITSVVIIFGLFQVPLKRAASCKANTRSVNAASSKIALRKSTLANVFRGEVARSNRLGHAMRSRVMANPPQGTLHNVDRQ